MIFQISPKLSVAGDLLHPQGRVLDLWLIGHR